MRRKDSQRFELVGITSVPVDRVLLRYRVLYVIVAILILLSNIDITDGGVSFCSKLLMFLISQHLFTLSVSIKNKKSGYYYLRNVCNFLIILLVAE